MHSFLSVYYIYCANESETHENNFGYFGKRQELTGNMDQLLTFIGNLKKYD